MARGRSLAGQDPAGGHEGARLGEAVSEDVQQRGAQGEGSACRGREREQSHVLDAGVGEHAV